MYTLLELRQTLWPYGGPNVAYANSTTQQKADFDAKLNRAAETLMAKVSPKYGRRRVNVPVYDGCFTLPRQFATLRGAVPASCCSCGSAYTVYSNFFEFSQPFDGIECLDGIIHATDVAQTFRIPEAPFTLRCIATAVDDDITLIGGTDTSDNEYLSSVALSITNGTTTTTRVYNSLPFIEKPLTASQVKLYSVDQTTGDATLIAVYAPNETVPAYQRWQVPNCCETFVMAWGQLGFSLATGDTEILYPNNRYALELGLRALRRGEVEDSDKEQRLWDNAVKVLDDERKLLEGGKQTMLNVHSGFGVGDIGCPV